MYNSVQDELKHYGILGMKWGVRRYQNKDGTLTSAGKKKQTTSENKKTNAKSNKLSRDERRDIRKVKNKILNSVILLEKDMDRTVDSKIKRTDDDVLFDELWDTNVDAAWKMAQKHVQEKVDAQNTWMSQNKSKFPEGIKTIKYSLDDVDWDDFRIHPTIIMNNGYELNNFGFSKPEDRALLEYLKHSDIRNTKDVNEFLAHYYGIKSDFRT